LANIEQVRTMHVHRLKRLGCAVVLAAISAFPLEAASQPVLSGEEAAKLADAYFLRGKALLKDGKVKEAYKEYKASWDLKKSYDIAANLGNIEYELGMPRDAAEHLAFSVRNAAVSVGSDRLEKIKKVLDQAKALVSVVIVRVNVDGAEVLIDGESVGRSPISEELYVDPGPRTIEARLSGHENTTKTEEFARASTRTVYLELKRLPVTMTTAPGEVPRPIRGDAPRKNMLPVAVGGGVAVAGLGLGLVSILLSNMKSTEAAGLRTKLASSPEDVSACFGSTKPACAQLGAAYVASASFRNLAVIGFSVGGVAALATATYALIPPSAPARDHRVRASFSVGPGGGGVAIHGQF
jgi:tetratricopeptide (TPR) repeat protein